MQMQPLLISGSCTSCPYPGSKVKIFMPTTTLLNDDHSHPKPSKLEETKKGEGQGPGLYCLAVSMYYCVVITRCYLLLRLL